MAEQFQLGSTIVTFKAGPNKTQMVEVHTGTICDEFTLREFFDVFNPIITEWQRRLLFGAPESAK